MNVSVSLHIHLDDKPEVEWFLDHPKIDDTTTWKLLTKDNNGVFLNGTPDQLRALGEHLVTAANHEQARRYTLGVETMPHAEPEAEVAQEVEVF